MGEVRCDECRGHGAVPWNGHRRTCPLCDGLGRYEVGPFFDEPYVPPPRLQAIARRRPEVEWLCYLPRDERKWWLTDRYRLCLFISIYPSVTEDEWLTLSR